MASDRWSLSLGSCWELSLRAHLSLLLAAVLMVAATAATNPVGGLLLLSVVVTSAALHEAAHQVIAMRLMGQRQPIVLTPIGGLRLPSVPNDPEVQLLVGMVGPLVNLALVVLSAGLLAYGSQNLAGVFSLTGPEGMLQGAWHQVLLKSALWVNWLTFLVSLIPAFPFDGGPALRAALWPLFGQRSAALFCAQLARVVGLSLAVAAVLVVHSSPELSMSLAAPMGCLAIMVICSAQYELAMTVNTGGVALGGLLENASKPVGARLGPSDQGGLQLDEAAGDTWLGGGFDPTEQPLDEDAAVDEILARLHVHGPQDLSDHDRQVLQRASQRYRDRQRGKST